MKLAEALINRSDLNSKIQQVLNRMNQNAKIQEGDEPSEDVSKLISLYESLMDELEKLIIRINKTNHQTMLDDISLADAITKRDNIKSQISSYQKLYEFASYQQNRYTQQEIKYIRCIDINQLQNKIDDLSKKYRQLDTKMQSLNWTVDLL